MKYMISWFERPQGSPAEYENARKRILEVFGQWKAPAGFKIELFVVRVGWARVSGLPPNLSLPPEASRRRPHCRIYLEQMRQVIRTVGKLEEKHIAPEARQELLGVFRNWKKGA